VSATSLSVMRLLLSLLLLLGFLDTGALRAQASRDPNAFRYGVGYDFERKFATRHVVDAYDQGDIRLATYIWRPIGANRHEVVLFNHGSLGGLTNHPAEPVGGYVPDELLEYLVRRGYTVVAPMRRGIGESTGTFREECAFAAGRCSLADYRALAEPGMQEAVQDDLAVIDQIVEGGEVPRGTRIVIAGVSRGGFLSLRVAAERPQQVAGVLNFVGGWLSLKPEWPKEENEARRALLGRLIESIGRRVRAPTLWLYASRDPFYTEADSRALFDRFHQAGGKGDFFFVADHSLRIGHELATAPKLWDHEVAGFLAQVHSAAGQTAH
jgi:dienelactone hydrolase